MRDILQEIDAFHLEDLRNEVHPSVFEVTQNYEMLIVRLPVIEKELEFSSVGFILTDDISFIYDKKNATFKELKERFESPHEILNETVDNLLKSFEKYRDLILNQEENLYLNKRTATFIHDWLDLKRDILRIERILIHTASTIDDVVEYYKETEGFALNNYLDLHEHIERTLRSATLQLSKLDYLYNFYSARTNEKMNSMIYTLTIISAIFLPLNLIVGFFGMNTSGLPFTEGASGTFSVVLVIIFILISTTLLIKFLTRNTK